MDKAARRLFDIVAEVDEMLQHNVKAVEALEADRSRSVSDTAIYFALPTEANVSAILEDFQSSKSSVKRKYQAAHLFFLSSIPDTLFSKLTDRSAKYWLTLKELNIDYYPFESRIFSLERPGAFESLFSLENHLEEVISMAKQLKSVCLTLGGNPIIRYQNTFTATEKAPEGPAQALAFALQNQLDKYMEENPGFGGPGPEQEESDESMEGPLHFAHILPPRPTLLIIDRAHDLCAPVLHELTYQALVNDVLEISDGRHYRHKFVNGFGEVKEEKVLLDDRDPLWKELRHYHIAEATQELLKRFQSLATENAAAANLLQKKDDSLPTVGQMRDVVAAIPELQAQVTRYSIHIELARLVTEEVGSSLAYPITEILEAEQILATKLDDSGEPVTHPLPILTPLLNNPSIPSQHKIRLLLLYIIFRNNNISTNELSRLANHAGLSDSENLAFERFRQLLKKNDEETSSSSSSFFPSFFQSDPTEKQDLPEESEYAFSRYHTKFKKLLDTIAQTALPSESFPFTVPENNEELSSVKGYLRVAKPTWQKKQQRSDLFNIDVDLDDISSSKGQLIVFVLGGITYSEMRCVYELARKHQRDVIAGSTHIITPQQFIDQLQGHETKPCIVENHSPSPPLSYNSSTTSLTLEEVPLTRSISEGNTPPEANTPSYDSASLDRNFHALPIRRISTDRSSSAPRPRSAYFAAHSSKLRQSALFSDQAPPALPPRRT